MITKKEIREKFVYYDGKLIWIKTGKAAGSDNGNGYTRVSVDGKNYYLHRLVWMYFNDGNPEIVDHIDNDKTNNRIENLRASNKSQNGFNSSIKSSNLSGNKNVYWNERKRKWVVAFTLTKSFKSKEDAVAFSKVVRRDLHGEFSRDV